MTSNESTHEPQGMQLPDLDPIDDLPLPVTDSGEMHDDDPSEVSAVDDSAGMLPPMDDEPADDGDALGADLDVVAPPVEAVEAPEVDHEDDTMLSDDAALKAAFRASAGNGGELPEGFSMTDEPSLADLFDLDSVLEQAIDFGASDVHISPDNFVAFSRLGEIVRQPEFGRITGAMTESIEMKILTNQLEASFVEELELDTSYVIHGGRYDQRRFRLSVGKTLGDIFFVFRVISDNIPTPEELDVSAKLRAWSTLPNGLVMMNGPTGTGKALALSTMIPTPDGPKELREIKAGSLVFDSKHNVVRVTGLSDIDEAPELYRITLSGGQVILADANHQWIVSTHSSRASARDKRMLELKAKKDRMLQVAASLDHASVGVEKARANEIHELITSFGAHEAFPRVDSLQRVFRFMDTPYEGTQYTGKVYGVKKAFGDIATRIRQRYEYAETSPLRVMTTSEMIDEGITTKYSGSNFGLPVATDGGLNEDIEQPIDPYLFGYWLGDGTSCSNSIAVGYEDLDDSLSHLAPRWEGEVRVTEHSGAAEIKLVTKDKPFLTTLRELGVYGNKHIPNVYLRGSREQRLELLRGLMDSDGSASDRDKAAGIGFANKRLTEDALSLVRSLGMNATLLYKDTFYPLPDGSRKQCKGAYHFNFTSDEQVFKLDRKQTKFARDERRSLSDWIYVRSIERVDPADADYESVRCISVDSEDHSYLCADQVVTHNSTTLASLLNAAILERPQKVITIERPIEYLFSDDGKGFVTQREVGQDTRQFANALDSAMRQAPDIIMIGESRNRTEIDQVLRAAETGHLAMTTMHTNSAAATLNRIKSLFDGSEQNRVLSTLADVSRGFANQVLVKTIDGESRFAIRELLEFDEEVSNLVTEGDIKGIRRYQVENHLTMEDGLVKAVVDGRCTIESARAQSAYPLVFDKMLKGMG